MKKERNVHAQLLFIMRVSMLNLVLAVAVISLAQANELTAQVLDKRVSVDLENVSLRAALTRIERAADVKFLYHSNVISSRDRIQFTASDERLADILREILGPRHIRFEAEGNQIILTKETMGLLMQSLRGASEEFQERIVTGAVTNEDNEPLPGVNILVKGTSQGTTTDFDGKYTIQVSGDDAVLVFSFIGYATQEVTVGTRTSVDITMNSDTYALQEVVVVGYGEMEKRDITGSVAQVKAEELQSVPVYNVEQALKARAAGVQVTQNSGEPGGRIEVRIRGGNSMIGDNQPLYVVDGFPITGGIEFLNPTDIESIDILKDASATAIYGARGANGVVIVTTKRGKAGQASRIEINSYYGVQQETKRYDLLNAREYAIIANEWLRNSGQAPHFTNLDEIQNPGTDWQDVVLRTAPVQDHTISFSGSSEKTRYSLSGNYFTQDGILINSGVKRGSLRLNLDHELNNWLKMAVNLNVSRRQRQSVPVNNGYRGTALLSAAASAPPTLPVYDEEGRPTEIEKAYSFGSSDMRNPLVFAARQTTALSNSVVGNTTFEVKLTEELTFKTLLGLEYGHNLTDYFEPLIFAADRGVGEQKAYYRNSFLNENTLSYAKTFDEIHSLNVVAGYTYQTDMSRDFGVRVSGFSNNVTENYNLGAAEVINTPTSNYSEWVLASWLGRVNYTFNDRYLLTASVRADGSSRFGANNRWATFPSVAVGWRISEEAFMQEQLIVSDLKLRASYGKTGNTALSPYQSLDRMTSERTVYGNQTDVVGFRPSGIANADLKWETTTQLDIGFDIGILQNRIRVTADYYKKNTTDLLASVPLPPSIGFGTILRNIGEIQNTGFEFTVGADIITTNKLRWDVTASYSNNNNEVVELAGGSDIFSAGQASAWSSTNIARVGEPLGMFYGYLEDGLTDDGFIKYKDVHEDGTINSLDRVILGNPTPDFFYALNTNVAYGNFELGVFFEGVQGNEIFNATNGTHLNSFQRGSNQFQDIMGNYWSLDNPNPNAKYPKISPATSIDISDRFIEDGSYLRLKSVRLAYNLPVKDWGLNWVGGAQVYFSGINLLTFTNYTGLDPEVSTRGTDNNNFSERLQMGHDQSGYPNAKTYALGVKLNF